MPRKNYFNYGRYRMKASDYYLMLENQNGCCAICKKKSPAGKRLHIDHDHENGEVRGLLCQQCNTFIGLAYEDLEILSRAAKYLKDGGHPSRFYIEGGRLITSYSKT